MASDHRLILVIFIISLSIDVSLATRRLQQTSLPQPSFTLPPLPGINIIPQQPPRLPFPTTPAAGGIQQPPPTLPLPTTPAAGGSTQQPQIPSAPTTPVPATGATPAGGIPLPNVVVTIPNIPATTFPSRPFLTPPTPASG